MANLDQRSQNPDYQDDLPLERAKTWNLLEQYSKIPADEIEGHVRAIVSAHPICPAVQQKLTGG